MSLLGSRQVVGGAESILVQIGLKRLKDGSFLSLAGCGVDPGSMFELYRQRWDIETLFAALKSRGFDLEETHLTEPDRIRKLLGVLALTYSWTRIVGLDRKSREGPPRECANGYCANGYPEKSLFRYGLDRLKELLTNWYRMQEELSRYAQAFASPQSFLSCS